VLPDLIKTIAEIGNGLNDLIIDAEVQKAVFQGPPDKKLKRQVIHPLFLLGIKGLLGLNPLFHHDIAKSIGQGLIDIGGAGPFRIPPLKTHEVMNDIFLDRRSIGGKIDLGSHRLT
jgi:hypothetical protein